MSSLRPPRNKTGNAHGPLGRVIDGRYRLVGITGKGGMSCVYEAEHVYTRARFALKLLLPLPSVESTIADRFLQEARSLARLSHPNIVRVTDFGVDPELESQYMVQELLVGMDLRQVLTERGRLPVEETLELLIPVMGALQAAHSRGILHRDVKPSNIFLAADEQGRRQPKLIDFGIAKLLDAQHALVRTVAGLRLGTISYMSREQLLGDRPIDARTDVWAMGVVFFELLAGRRPYISPTGNLHDIGRQIVCDPPPRIEEFMPDIPAPLADVIHRALTPSWKDRTPSMSEMLKGVLAVEAALRASALDDTIEEMPSVRFRESLTIPPAAPAEEMLDPSVELDASIVIEMSGTMAEDEPVPPVIELDGEVLPDPPPAVEPGEATPPVDLDATLLTREPVPPVPDIEATAMIRGPGPDFEDATKTRTLTRTRTSPRAAPEGHTLIGGRRRVAVWIGLAILVAGGVAGVLALQAPPQAASIPVKAPQAPAAVPVPAVDATAAAPAPAAEPAQRGPAAKAKAKPGAPRTSSRSRKIPIPE